jgi:hypothetical protein
MRPFSLTRADGTSRYRPKVEVAPKQKSRITNGRRPSGIDGRSAEARRLRDLAEAYGEGLDLADERIRALVRDTAAAGVKLELGSDKISNLEFVRLSGVRRRGLAKLEQLRGRRVSSEGAGELREGAGDITVEQAGGLQRLRDHLDRLMRQD